MGTLKIKDIEHAKPNGDKPRKLFDGDGLHLYVKPNGAKLWRLKYRFEGRELTLSFGPFGEHPPGLTLKAARLKSATARGLLAQGIDPGASMTKHRPKPDAAAEVAAAGKPFCEVSKEWLGEYEAKHDKPSRDGRTPSLDREKRNVRVLNEAFAGMDIKTPKQSDVTDVLTAFERAETYEARTRIQSTARRIFGFAQWKGYRTDSPMPVVRDTLGMLTAPLEIPRPAIVEPKAFGTLLRLVADYPAARIRKALTLLALTCVRPGDVAHCRWTEIGDIEAGEWRIPFQFAKMRTERAKNKKPQTDFRVPLSRQAKAVLRELRAECPADEPYVFAKRPGRASTTDDLNRALKAMGFDGVHCGHGFRSSGRTILGMERLADGRSRFEEKTLELQLDHLNQKTVNAGNPYDRDDHWRERIVMMQHWADMLDDLRTGGAVVPFRVTG